MSKRKIIPALFFFEEESIRRNYVDNEYKYFEECGVPYLAILVKRNESREIVDADFELINLTEKEALPIIEYVQTNYFNGATIKDR